MDGITMPYLPTTLWLLAGALTILILLIFLGNLLFFQKRRKREVELREDEEKAKLETRKQYLKADVDALREYIQEQKAELERLNAQREEQRILEARLNDLDQQCLSKEEHNREVRKEVGELENQIHNFSDRVEKLKKEASDLDQKKSDADLIENRLLDMKTKLEETNAILKEAAVAKINLDELLNKKATLEGQKDKLQDLLESSKKETDVQLEIERQAERDATELIEKVRDFEKKIESQKNEIKHLKEDKGLIENQIGLLNQKEYKLEEQIKDLEKKKPGTEEKIKMQVSKLENAKEKLSDTVQELKDTKDELAIQERFESEIAKKVREKNIKLDELRAEDNALKAAIRLHSKELDEKKSGGAISKDKYSDLWHPVPFQALTATEGDVSEKMAIEKTADYIKGQNLYFHERVLYAFHTALKVADISPIVVLAGISGTGKSELPRRYAEGMGLHFVILPVQPRWDSPQDLFGFYNYLEGRYKATELARAMVQFELYNTSLWPLPKGWDHGRSDRMLLVLLDEMNLARVEYYFSEFLSRLETRRGINHADEKERAKAEIALEMGSLHEGETAIRLFPGQNILFTGTMNEDETTQALSDKVLDRSCVMRFGRPKEIISRTTAPRIEPSENGITFDQWRNWMKEESSPVDRSQVNEWINILNESMEKLNRPFGHRAAQAMQSYVANYPDWATNRIKTAMADQIEQRILPKLRGIEISDTREALRKIQSVIDQCEDSQLLKAFKKGYSNQEIFIWRGIDRIEE
jgi:hypothetical protein